MVPRNSTPKIFSLITDYYRVIVASETGYGEKKRQHYGTQTVNIYPDKVVHIIQVTHSKI